MLDGQETEIMDLYFKILGFFEEENSLFNFHIKNNDVQTYMSGYRIAFEKIFEASKLRPSVKQEPSIDAKVKEAAKTKTKSSLPPSKSSFEKKESKESQKESQKEPPQREEIKSSFKKTSSNSYERENRFVDAEKALDTFLSKLETKSREPKELFSNVASSSSMT
jgi:hypothetical protein